MYKAAPRTNLEDLHKKLGPEFVKQSEELQKLEQEIMKHVMEKETHEYDLLQHIKFCLECKNESQAIRLIEKYGFQKQQERYSEEDLDAFRKFMIQEQNFSKSCLDVFVEQFKKK